MKIKKIILYSLLGFGLFILGSIANNDPTTTPLAKAAEAYDPPRELVYLSQKLGLPQAALNQTHAQIGIGQANALCNPQFFVACFDQNTQRIYLYLRVFQDPNEDPATTLAYEYSHYIWLNTSEATKANLKVMLDQLYLANKGRIDATQQNLIRVEGGFGSMAFDDEMHSIACTEMQDNELQPALLAHCASFLPNRSALKNIY